MNTTPLDERSTAPAPPAGDTSPRTGATVTRSYLFSSVPIVRAAPIREVPRDSAPAAPAPSGGDAPRAPERPAPTRISTPPEAPAMPPRAPEAPTTRPMTDRELRRLSRGELLELLLSQTREVESLRAQLREAEEKLRSRELTLASAGSIAQAAMELNGVFEAAQRAADQYLENVRNLYPDR